MNNLTFQEQLAQFKNNTSFVEVKEEKHIDKFKNKTNYKKDEHTNTEDKTIVHNNKINNSESVMCEYRENYNDLQWGEVLYVDLDLDKSGIGSEQKGIRYAICVQNPIGNKFSPTTIVAFVTSKITKAKLPLIHVEIPAGHFGLPKDSVVLLEQIRTLDKRRIKKRVGKLDELTSLKIEKALYASTDRKLDSPKTLLERLSEESRSYIINKIKLIEDCKKSIELVHVRKGSQENIDFFEDMMFEEDNSLHYYCDKKGIDYNEIYNNYLEIEKKKEESIAL